MKEKFHQETAAPWQLHVCLELCVEVTMSVAEVNWEWERTVKLGRAKAQMMGTPATVTWVALGSELLVALFHHQADESLQRAQEMINGRVI